MLAVPQATLLFLTARKADCEHDIAIASMHKTALTRAQSDLSQEYYSRLQAKQLSYYANGQYNTINYSYLMGYGSQYTAILNGSQPLKSDNSVVLADYKGQVIMSDTYANAIISVLGNSAMDSHGRGGTFSTDKIAAIMAAFLPGFSEEDFQTVIDNGKLDSSYDTENVNTMTGETNGNTTTVDNSDTLTSSVQSLVDFYYPIFAAAAANGWTTEYNEEIGTNENYISDAIVNGTFQLEEVESDGNYDVDTSLTYFTTNGFVQARTDSDVREEVTAWYEGEKARISDKENYYDILISDLSTELEAINTEIQSVESFVEDGVSTFEWGNA